MTALVNLRRAQQTLSNALLKFFLGFFASSAATISFWTSVGRPNVLSLRLASFQLDVTPPGELEHNFIPGTKLRKIKPRSGSAPPIPPFGRAPGQFPCARNAWYGKCILPTFRHVFFRAVFSYEFLWRQHPCRPNAPFGISFRPVFQLCPGRLTKTLFGPRIEPPRRPESSITAVVSASIRSPGPASLMPLPTTICLSKLDR